METNAPPWANLPARGPYLRPKKAAEYLGISKTTFYRLVNAGKIPAPIRFGSALNAAVGVPQVWLDAAIAGNAA